MAVRAKPAGIFLAIVATLIILVVAGFLWIQADPARALRIAFTPGEPFTAISADPIDYTDNVNWAVLPGTNTFASAKPAGIADVTVMPEVDVFFIHPTTYLSRESWNAPLDHADANLRIEKRVLKMQASAYNLAGNIYAPRYRQATFGAFFDDAADGLQSLVFAYNDVQMAFDQFIADRNDERPFILAGHSQGSLHALALLKQRIAGTPLADRMIAAYIIGWPVSMEADLGALEDIDACASADDTRCVVSYQTFGPKGDTNGVKVYFETSVGLGGMPRKDTKMLCVNPLNWTIDGNAPAAANAGAMERVGDEDAMGSPVIGFNGARCDDDGFLYLENEPGEPWQHLKMAGENYHVYDYHMFYMNIRENAATRAAAWKAVHP